MSLCGLLGGEIVRATGARLALVVMLLLQRRAAATWQLAASNAGSGWAEGNGLYSVAPLQLEAEDTGQGAVCARHQRCSKSHAMVTSLHTKALKSRQQLKT